MSRKRYHIPHRLIAFFLFLTLTMGLFASCKSSVDKDPLRTVEVTNRYRVVPFEAPEGFTADRPYAIGGKIYIRYYQGNYNEDQKNRLYVYDQTGAVVEKHELTVANPGGLYYSLIPSDDGAYYTVDKLKSARHSTTARRSSRSVFRRPSGLRIRSPVRSCFIVRAFFFL